MAGAAARPSPLAAGAFWAYAAMLAAMLVSSGNFLFGNLAVREIGPVTLAFWRNAVALACTVPFVVRGRPDLAGYFRRRKLELLVLSGLGSVLTAWFMYLGLRADDLINLSFGYTLIPLMAVLFSALLLGDVCPQSSISTSGSRFSARWSSRSTAISSFS